MLSQSMWRTQESTQETPHSYCPPRPSARELWRRSQPHLHSTKLSVSFLFKLVCTLFRQTFFFFFFFLTLFKNIFHKPDPNHLHSVVIVYFKTLNLPHFPIFLCGDLDTVLMKNIMLKPPLLKFALLL